MAITRAQLRSGSRYSPKQQKRKARSQQTASGLQALIRAADIIKKNDTPRVKPSIMDNLAAFNNARGFLERSTSSPSPSPKKKTKSRRQGYVVKNNAMAPFFFKSAKPRKGSRPHKLLAKSVHKRPQKDREMTFIPRRFLYRKSESGKIKRTKIAQGQHYKAGPEKIPVEGRKIPKGFTTYMKKRNAISELIGRRSGLPIASYKNFLKLAKNVNLEKPPNYGF